MEWGAFVQQEHHAKERANPEEDYIPDAAESGRLLHPHKMARLATIASSVVRVYFADMSIDIVNSIYGETARLDIHEVVRRLNAHLGATLVAALTGSKDSKQPHRWAKSDGPVPGPDFERRLRLAHRAWRQIADAENDHLARAWFIGGNPWLDEDAPLTGIREDRDSDVMNAVAALLEDRQDV